MNNEVGQWITGNDTGTSSKTIWSVFVTGKPPVGGGDIPLDPSDFGRCYRLLLLAPEWRQRMREMTAACPNWGPLVAIWDELDAMYREVIADGGWNMDASRRMLDRMRDVRDECMTASGWVKLGAGSWSKMR
jgi:hypothetical protein